MLLILKTIKIFKKYYESIVVMWQHVFSSQKLRPLDHEAGTEKINVEIDKEIKRQRDYLYACNAYCVEAWAHASTQ